MKIYRFDAEVGYMIEPFDSVNCVMSKVVHQASEARISCAYLRPNGRIDPADFMLPLP